MSNKNVFVAGGCHVGGHLVGMSNSFLAQFLSQRTDVGFVGWSRPISVKRAINFFQDRNELLNSDTLVILQLGNFETSQSLTPKFLSRFRSISQSTTSSGILNSRPSESGDKVYAIRPLLASLFKFPLVFFYELFGYSPFDSRDFESRLRVLFDLLKKAKMERVVVLITFFSLHPGLNFYRRKANLIIKKLGAEFSFEVLDAYSVTKDIWYIESVFFGNANFADYEHLSKAGHSKVAKELHKILG